MAKPTIDFSIPLADYLATPVSDGTNSDIFETEKQDAAGYQAAATDIENYYGELWANRVDAFFLATYQQLQGAQQASLSTNGALTDSLTVATLSADGDAYYVEATVLGKTSAAGELVVVELSGVFYRTGGTVFPMAPVHTVTEVGLTGADANLVINTNNVDIVTTGVAAKVIGWDVVVRKVQEFTGP